MAKKGESTETEKISVKPVCPRAALLLRGAEFHKCRSGWGGVGCGPPPANARRLADGGHPLHMRLWTSRPRRGGCMYCPLFPAGLGPVGLSRQEPCMDTLHDNGPPTTGNAASREATGRSSSPRASTSRSPSPQQPPPSPLLSPPYVQQGVSFLPRRRQRTSWVTMPSAARGPR